MTEGGAPATSRRRSYIFVVGGVMSGVGKGIATASIGALLKARGLRVTAVKIDPYLNVDPGTLNPVEHGEVFVTRDGLETDQDLGNYERFLEEDLGRENCMTSGSVFQSVINRERALEYGGKTVEVVPHIPFEVINRIRAAAEKKDADVTIVEIGGTVGEYQNVLYLEACRMMRLEQPGDVLVALVSYLPVPKNIGEMKTKPTQYATRTLNGTGLQPDLIICRSTLPVDEPRKQKISLHCNVSPEDVIAAPDVESIYEVPLRFEQEGITERILKKLGMEEKLKAGNLQAWTSLNEKIKNGTKGRVKIGIVGKYFSTGDFVLTDSYLSVLEAIKHAAWHLGVRPEMEWLNSEDIEQKGSAAESLQHLDGVLIPGGFGTRGIRGKIQTIQFVRENRVPYLGLCYGMQLACLEAIQNQAGRGNANTTEIDPGTPHPVIHLMNEQEEKLKDADYGGTMRLGVYPCELKAGSKSAQIYGSEQIEERHRHRYEVNPMYHAELEKCGLNISGFSPDGSLAEIVERPDHPFFVAVQFHPEFQSRPFAPHPLFVEFLRAAMKRDGRHSERTS